jgi:hypothetical protein
MARYFRGNRRTPIRNSVFLLILGTACGADFYATANDKASSPEESSCLLDSSTTERRRSERVKREKPDYYDALEFENKRKATTTPTRLDESAYFYNNENFPSKIM